ncbi:hypothetical protein BDV33DRAFT_12594 [Aspergillus novoparasiticus]|uniref:t-SNARE coiled-coil homology domain-containing protein n=1 Tax=Aspergillus novoparasiticus TaxID=986946 RepID=A0A5N6F2X1_9EURO|nr:hypothetical protein BDV33DRAFT_12594 [Aspergillus novoparasiticus]
MGDAYEREQQNNALLNSLSSKVSALKSVTIDIHDNARDQDTLDHSNTESGLLLPVNKPDRQRQPLDPHGTSRRYRRRFESRRDSRRHRSGIMDDTGMDFLSQSSLFPSSLSLSISMRNIVPRR